jgi:hypothetical protein
MMNLRGPPPCGEMIQAMKGEEKGLTYVWQKSYLESVYNEEDSVRRRVTILTRQ